MLEKILIKLESMDQRLINLEKSTEKELQQLRSTVDLMAIGQQEDVIDTLQHLDAKMATILETQKLNFEILRVFSGDLIQH